MIVELPVDLMLRITPTESANESSLIYNHLLHYCSKFASASLLPAVVLTDTPNDVAITKGHEYLRIAKVLGISSIRAIVSGKKALDLASTWMNSGNARLIAASEIARETEEMDVIEGWHVFYFQSRLSAQQMSEFEARIVGFFHTLTSSLLSERNRQVAHVKFAADGLWCEFQATTPVGDPSWFSTFYDACKAFHTDVAKIESYQGRAFACN